MATPSTIARNANKPLLHLYRRLLRSAANFPSIKRESIYQAIREDFRENAILDPESDKAKIQAAVAYKGLSQLRQFDVENMISGKGGDSDWEIHLEQNPMPKPANYGT